MEVDLSSIMVCGIASEEVLVTAECDYDEHEPAPKPSKKPIPVSSETTEDATAAEDNKDRRELVTQIRQCLEEFPEKLSALKGVAPEKLTMEELQKVWSEIEYTMGEPEQQLGVRLLTTAFMLHRVNSSITVPSPEDTTPTPSTEVQPSTTEVMTDPKYADL